MGLMSSIVSIGTVILQSAINKLGMTIISAQISARRIMSFALLPMTAISSSMTTFTSQNFGAKQFRRIQQGVKQACLLSLLWSVFVAILLFFTSPFLTSLISGSTNPNLFANASLRKLTPLISSFIELTGKILFVLLIIPHTGYIGVILCEPLIWVPMTLQLWFTYHKASHQLLASSTSTSP